MTRPLHNRLAYLLALPIALLLLFIRTTGTFASTVHISDQANVLNTSQVQNEASNLNYPVNIYTTNTFNGTEAAFDQRADAKVTSTRLIVIAIDTVHRYLRIAGGRHVPLQMYQYNEAISAFKTNFNTGAGYTNATIAALQSLESSLASSNGNAPTSAGAGLAWLPYLPICCIGLFVLAGLALVGIVRSRRRRFMGGPVTPPVNPVLDPMNPTYNHPPYYGPGYPGGYNQGGIGPWGAGGLVGYELGKEAGERDALNDQGYNNGADGNFDNNGGNDFGAGASGDFGNGGSDFGGGGDFGGGASGDFGNGGGDTGGSGSF